MSENNDMNSSFKESKKFGADLKIIIVGNSATGKTSIINRYIKNSFSETYKATIASEFSYKIIKKNDMIYRLQFWDLGGQDKSHEITKIFARDSNGVVMVCDVQDIQTRKDIVEWLRALEDGADIKGIPIVLLENKCDLLGKETEYNKDIESLNKFAKDNNFIGAYRTSAKIDYGITEAIQKLVDEIIASGKADIQSYKSASEIKGSKLEEVNYAKNKSGCC